MDMQIVGEVVLGLASVALPAACQLSIKKMAPNVVFESFTQAGVEGGSAGLVKALFPSCPGYFCTTVSFLPHLTV